MFTIYNSDSSERTLIGPAQDTLEGVILVIENHGAGRYEVFESGDMPRRWGALTRNRDGTFVLEPDRSRHGMVASVAKTNH
jgi:hypothetical protein